MWERQEKAAYRWQEDSLYTPSSFPSSLFTTTSPLPLSVSASARTNPAHLKELKLCKHLVECLRLVPSDTHPRSPTGLPEVDENIRTFFFFFRHSPPPQKKREKLQSKKGPFYVWRWDAVVSTSPSSSSKNIKRLAEALPTSWCRWPDSDGTF